MGQTYKANTGARRQQNTKVVRAGAGSGRSGGGPRGVGSWAPAPPGGGTWPPAVCGSGFGQALKVACPHAAERARCDDPVQEVRGAPAGGRWYKSGLLLASAAP